MVTRLEALAGFDQIADLLRASAAANAHALRAHRGTPTGDAVDQQLEHTLDRLAMLYGRGTYENLSTAEIFETALEAELRLAAEAEAQVPGSGAPHVARARALEDVARRGRGLDVRAGLPQLFRGAYIAPFSSELRSSFAARHEPFIAWRDGIVAVLPEAELAQLRDEGFEVLVLFLDADELLDLDSRVDRPALGAELDRRLATARAAPDHVGDSRARHRARSLLGQSTVLRNLRDRLAADHPVAHRALVPVIADHRADLEHALTSPVVAAAPAEPLAASVDHERELQRLVHRWAAEPETAGLGNRFSAVAGAGTHLPELDRHLQSLRRTP